MSVYKAINAVQLALSKAGITKDRRNTQGAGYNFRGIDDVLNVLSPLLAEHQLLILPRGISRHQEERQSKSGGALFYTSVHMEYDLVSAVDGSKHTISMFGEAMDSSDKSTNKAESAAYKYAAFQAFCIPTEGDNDADASTHEPAAKNAAPLPVGAVAVPKLITQDQFNTLKLADPSLVERILKKYKLKDIGDLTADQAAKGLEFIATETAKKGTTTSKQVDEPF